MWEVRIFSRIELETIARMMGYTAVDQRFLQALVVLEERNRNNGNKLR